MVVRDPVGVLVAVTIFVAASSALVGAWIVQTLGYPPCELCLAQRWPYYLGIPLAGLTASIAFAGPPRLLPPAFFGLAVIFAASALLGTYHSGVEWGFWPGPKDCSGAFDQKPAVEDFFRQLQSVKVVRCDAPALRILGLSLAGWNAIVSALLCGLAIGGTRRRS